MSTIHRKDITGGEMYLLARFSHALDTLSDEVGNSLVWEIGACEVWLPVWYLSAGGWQLSNYKKFTKEIIGIQKHDMRRIARYMRVRECELVKLLFRFSILAVVAERSTSAKPRFRMSFYGVKSSWGGGAPTSLIKDAFVLEKRRALGGFR